MERSHSEVRDKLANGAHSRRASARCRVCGSEDLGSRSTPQLRRYFAMLKAFYHHWPEAHPEQFYDADHFRKWAQMKCGHFRVQRLPFAQAGALGNVKQRERLKLFAEAMFGAAGVHAWPVAQGETLAIYTPKSVSYDKLSHGEATRLFGDVESFLERETGLNAHQVMEAHANAA
jgi:hypothetical protein